MSRPVIQAEHLSKQYRIGAERVRYKTAREAAAGALGSPVRLAKRIFRRRADDCAFSNVVSALSDVSFEVYEGDVVGIVGRNGAGKSTLLKVLSRISRPTSGRARIRGRIGSLLEVGTGFHPELTGRENIYLNGAVLGMKRGEIDRRFDEIVAFAETERFLDTPVKRYSSGMKVRLAFAVAAHLEPEILLIDEVLAVGDLAFQRKCLGKMSTVAESGRTVLFVSHSLAAVSALCTRGLLMRDGALVYAGSTADVIGRYLRSMDGNVRTALAARTDREGDGRLRFTTVSLLDGNGNPAPAAVSGQPLTMRLGYASADGREVRNVDVDIAFYGAVGQLLFYCKTQLGRGKFEVLPGRGSIDCRIHRFPLNPGQYRFKLWCEVNRTVADKVEDAGELVVEPGDFYGTGNLPTKNPEGVVMVEHGWAVAADRRAIAG